MVFITVYELRCRYLIKEIPHSLLQAGIYLDRMTLVNIVTNVRIISEYSRKAHQEISIFLGWLQEEVEKRKVKDRKVRQILDNLDKVTTLLVIFLKELHDLIPDLKKKEMEWISMPGDVAKEGIEIQKERIKEEDEKNFQIAKKVLKKRYNNIDQELEKGILHSYFKEIKERLFAPELMLQDLKSVSYSIASHLDDSYADVKQEQLLANIELYIKNLFKLSKIVSQELSSLLLDLRSEIVIWENVYKNMKKMNADNYLQLRAQLLKLLKDDTGIYQQIEAA